MPNNNHTRYKALLERKRAELVEGLRHRGDIVVQKTPDLLEEVQLASDREMAIRNLNRESILLRQVQIALDRIADGSYGACLHCDEEIKPKRLEALPWAAFCVRCQEAADRKEIESEEILKKALGESLVEAA